jgi:hypothetical protein
MLHIYCAQKVVGRATKEGRGALTWKGKAQRKMQRLGAAARWSGEEQMDDIKTKKDIVDLRKYT